MCEPARAVEDRGEGQAALVIAQPAGEVGPLQTCQPDGKAQGLAPQELPHGGWPVYRQPHDCPALGGMDLKESVEQEIMTMMKATGEPSEGRMKLLKTAIGFLAVQAKLEESEYGGFFEPDAAGVPVKPGPQPAASEGDDDGEPGDFFPEGPVSGLPS